MLAYKIQESSFPENLYGETSTGINSPNSVTRYKGSGCEHQNFDLMSSINNQQYKSSQINSFLIKPTQPRGDYQQIFSCSATQSFVEFEEVDESCFSENELSEKIQNKNPTVFVSQIERFFKSKQSYIYQSNHNNYQQTFSSGIKNASNLNKGTDNKNEIEEDEDEDDDRTVKFSIISQDSELLKQTELYRQIRYQKSGSTLKNSLLSYFNSSIGIPDEQRFDDIKISVCPLAFRASDHYFNKGFTAFSIISNPI